MHDQVKYAESKNSSIILFTSALLIGFVTVNSEIKDLITVNTISFLPQFDPDLFSICSIVLSLLLLLSTFISLLSFYPKITNNKLEKQLTNNMFFFSSLTKFTNSKRLSDYFTIRYINKRRIKIDISNQLLNLSIIAERKYKLFKISLLILLISPGIILSVVFLYFFFRGIL